MSVYTSNLEGFQRAMEWSLSGPPEEARDFSEAAYTPGFYRIFNGIRMDYDKNLQDLIEWRGKSVKYYPTVDQFLRDGNRLAAHMTGTLEVDGVATFFESFMFAEVDGKDGRMEWMVERSIWGAQGGKPEHGEA